MRLTCVCENCLESFLRAKAMFIILIKNDTFLDEMVYCPDCAKKVNSFDDVVKDYRRV